MKKRTAITLEEHRLLAMGVFHIKDCLYALHTFLLDKETGYSEINRLSSMEASLDSMRRTLDKKYRRLVDDETFNKLGHIYYYSTEKKHESKG